MSKFTVILSLSFAYICVCTLFTSPVSGGSLNPSGGSNGVLPSGGSAAGAASNRKVRILNSNPGLVRLFRLLSRSNGLSPDDEDVFGGEDESYFQKRQQYDDYGHMRFGKRNPKDFDDYGHMRFGRK